jgi:XTP/dITP diphosphohydrolase
MPDRIVLASNNRGKLAELQALFAPLGVALVRQADLGVPEAEEPFRTHLRRERAGQGPQRGPPHRTAGAGR